MNVVFRVENQIKDPLMFNFEKLQVWRKAIVFVDLVYSATLTFPAEERFRLTNQMRRAAVSVSSNISEGCSRISKADFKRFLEIATGSVFEVVSEAFVARRLGFLTEDAFLTIYNAAEEQSRMLSGLRKSFLRK